MNDLHANWDLLEKAFDDVLRSAPPGWTAQDRADVLTEVGYNEFELAFNAALAVSLQNGKHPGPDGVRKLEALAAAMDLGDLPDLAMLRRAAPAHDHAAE